MRADAPWFQRALLAEVDAAAAALALPDREAAVHACRLALKRARALARIARCGAPGLSAHFDRLARDAKALLAQERDVAALSSAARALARTRKKRRRRALTAVVAALDAAAARIAPAPRATMEARLADLQALAKVWPEPSAHQVRRGVSRIRRRARKAWRRAEGLTDATPRHTWRKREKDRLYALALAPDFWPGPSAQRRRLNTKLSDALGQEHDLIVLQEWIDANLAEASPRRAKRAQKAVARARAATAAAAEKLGARLHRGGA